MDNGLQATIRRRSIGTLRSSNKNDNLGTLAEEIEMEEQFLSDSIGSSQSYQEEGIFFGFLCIKEEI